MNKYLRYCTVLFALLSVTAGCKKDDGVQKKAESKLVQSTIAGVNGPTTGSVNQELTFSIIWQNTAGTTKFDHLKDSTSDNTKFIRLFALTNVPDTASVSPGGPNSVTYKFKAATAGTYYLKFYNSDNSDKTAIVDTLIIK
jgi:hypothetical protein